MSDIYYKAKNVDTDKALQAIEEARKFQRVKTDKEIAEKRAYLEGVERGLDIAQGIFECSDYEKKEIENARADMIIRNQDKNMITNFQQVTDMAIVNVEDMFAIRVYYPFNEERMDLGFYSTKEKAIKVLDMIQDAYIALNLNYPQYVANGYFQMPQESEVQI